MLDYAACGLQSKPFIVYVFSCSVSLPPPPPPSFLPGRRMYTKIIPLHSSTIIFIYIHVSIQYRYYYLHQINLSLHHNLSTYLGKVYTNLSNLPYPTLPFRYLTSASQSKKKKKNFEIFFIVTDSFSTCGTLHYLPR